MRSMQSARASGSSFINNDEACFGIEMAEDQGLGLCVLAGKEPGQLLRLRLLQRIELEGSAVFRMRQPLHHGLGAVFAKGLDQKTNGNVPAARRDEFARRPSSGGTPQEPAVSVSTGTFARFATSSVMRSTSSLVRLRRMGAASSSPRKESRMAALRAPLVGA